MAKLKMKRIEVVALLSDSKKIIERLQRRSVVELCDVRDDALVKMNTAASISLFEKNRAIAVSALEILEAASEQKKPLLSMLSGRRELEVHDFGKKAENADKYLRVCYDIVAQNKKIQDRKASIFHTETALESLMLWEGLEVPMQYAGTEHTAAFIGTFPGKYTEEELFSALADAALSTLCIEVIASCREQTCVMITCHRDEEEKTYGAIRELGFTQPADPTKHPPRVRIERFRNNLLTMREEIAACEEKIRSYEDRRPDLEFTIDYLTMRRDKYEALQKLAVTEHVFVLTGYIPEKYAGRLIAELEGKFDVAAALSEPEEDEDIPVLLENNAFARPVEGITEMYALPNRRDVDPNGVMAFFYYLFFGMMLSDAGYGILMLIGTTIALRFTKVEGNLRRSLRMFQYCGVSTLIWGALFGSWFGDLPQVIARDFFGKELGSLALWFEPLSDPMRLLLFSFLLGILHLFVGLGVNFYKLWQEGNKLDAFCDVIPVFLTVLGAVPLAGSILTPIPAILSQIGGYVAISGVILVVLTAGRSSKSIPMRFFGGIYGLYNVATGYLSDILSYSRLLALGLATGSIASVINLIAMMPSSPALKLVFLIVVGTVGHIANLGINLLGAYVHTDRLQFVEMFSKFYEGGGRAFAPFGTNTKYIKFKEETKDE